MSITRDILQGFIDGYITAGGDPSAINPAVLQYLQNHPLYPTQVDEQAKIVADLSSYRVSSQKTLAPLSVPLISIPASSLASVQTTP